MTLPVFENPIFGAIEARVLERRGREVAEAIPLPMNIVKELEMAVVRWIKDEKFVAAI